MRKPLAICNRATDRAATLVLALSPVIRPASDYPYFEDTR